MTHKKSLHILPFFKTEKNDDAFFWQSFISTQSGFILVAKSLLFYFPNVFSLRSFAPVAVKPFDAQPPKTTERNKDDTLLATALNTDPWSVSLFLESLPFPHRIS